jgi:hypothetical protein
MLEIAELKKSFIGPKGSPQSVSHIKYFTTGSMDLLLGGFHHGFLWTDEEWSWFALFLLDVPTLTQNQYRPGTEFDAAAGIAYDGLSLGRVRIAPLAQALFSARSSDSGANAKPILYPRYVMTVAPLLLIPPLLVLTSWRRTWLKARVLGGMVYCGGFVVLAPVVGKNSILEERAGESERWERGGGKRREAIFGGSS